MFVKRLLVSEMISNDVNSLNCESCSSLILLKSRYIDFMLYRLCFVLFK